MGENAIKPLYVQVRVTVQILLPTCQQLYFCTPESLSHQYEVSWPSLLWLTWSTSQQCHVLQCTYILLVTYLISIKVSKDLSCFIHWAFVSVFGMNKWVPLIPAIPFTLSSNKHQRKNGNHKCSHLRECTLTPGKFNLLPTWISVGRKLKLSTLHSGHS